MGPAVAGIPDVIRRLKHMIEQMKERLPEMAKDARINWTKVLDLTQLDGLTITQIQGAALAVAYHLNNPLLLESLQGLHPDTALMQSAKTAASLMAMSNIYYRFVHLSEDGELEQVPAGLRMQGMMNPGTDAVTFEVMCLAVSILNGCGACISAHTRQLKSHGLSVIGLSRIGKIAAVLHAVHVSLNL